MDIWTLNGVYVSPEDERLDRINRFYERFCSKCYNIDTCNKVELVNHIRCGFKPAYKKVWKIVSPENGSCTDCGEIVYNDKGICPKCKGNTEKQWVQTRVKNYY